MAKKILRAVEISCCRTLEFCAGHRVLGHEGKCSSLHGHQYSVDIFAFGVDAPVDSLGRVVDFSVLKEKVGGWIDEMWDHGLILFENDDECMKAAMSIKGQKFYTLPFNPTAENLAKYLIQMVCPAVLEGESASVFKVVVRETPNCSGTATVF